MIDILPAKIIEARGNTSQGKLVQKISGLSGKYITPKTISNWERGKSRPNRENFSYLCMATSRPASFFTEKIAR